MIWRYLGTPASLPAEKPALQYTNSDRASRPHSQLFIDGGARFVATNPDVSGPTESGMVPACGAVAALIESATAKAPFFVGKPNPLMMRMALNYLGAHSEETMMIGDRMDTDIVAGGKSGMMTTLVLSGVTTPELIEQFPYRPGQVLDSIAVL